MVPFSRVSNFCCTEQWCSQQVLTPRGKQGDEGQQDEERILGMWGT